MGNLAHTYDLYRDIQERCGGEIYIGVLGPVRTGKSTFIGRFMDELVLPLMEDSPAKTRALDELPQSAGGKTITTTEPKFVPNEAAEILLGDNLKAKVRLIDCVGYMVDGAVGHMEGEEERMVKTPWFDDPIPFTQAAEIGTDKVMNDHSTIGLVITTDGSIGELPRNAYEEAEKRTIRALKATGKPFLVLVNSKKPYSEEAKSLAARISQEEQVTAMTVNCEQLRKDDILRILEQILYEFPISTMEFYCPKWVEMLPAENPLRVELIRKAREIMEKCDRIRSVTEDPVSMESAYIKKCRTDSVGLSDGVIRLEIEPQETYYYDMLTEMVGEQVSDQYQLITPEKEEITLEQPEIIKQGSKYGVKIRAISPSIHMIKANIETEIAPIVGTKEQAEDLIGFINSADSGDGMWDTNIFGKSVQQLVNDGINTKISGLGPESQEKLQETMQKIVNDSNGGMVCIII